MFDSVIKYFYDIAEIPHQSGNTKAISDYCKSFAIEHSLEYIQDESNNIIIFKSASKNSLCKSPVIIQGHLDMVCVKEDSIGKDFSVDRLDIVNDEKFIFANGTSLGGDDGIAVAYALAILSEDSIEHPPIEAVFTVDEETGMNGAREIDVSKLKGKMLINIDSEDEGTLLVSCAGGIRGDFCLPIKKEKTVNEAVRIYLSDFTGGHSGTEIDKGRENAIIFTSRLCIKFDDIKLISINGGTADNAIPTSCEILLNTENADSFIDSFSAEFEKEKSEYLLNDKNAKLSIKKVFKEFECLSTVDTKASLNFILDSPNGVIKMSNKIEGLVQTSLNLGIIATTDDGIILSFAVRSSVDEEKNNLCESLEIHCKKFGAKSKFYSGYPAWEYNSKSILRDIFVSAFKKQSGKEINVTAIHAGVECGIFCGKIPNLDCVSIGPDIFDIHSTKEKLSIESAKRTYELIVDVLNNLSKTEEI